MTEESTIRRAQAICNYRKLKGEVEWLSVKWEDDRVCSSLADDVVSRLSIVCDILADLLEIPEEDR